MNALKILITVIQMPFVLIMMEAMIALVAMDGLNMAELA